MLGERDGLSDAEGDCEGLAEGLVEPTASCMSRFCMYIVMVYEPAAVP
jgi:hypothetical protein